MMRPPRGLSAEEAALWARIAATIKPIAPRAASQPKLPPAPVATVPQPRRTSPDIRPPASSAPLPTAPRPLDQHGLDAGWERRVARGAVQPDFTIDLHGHTLDSAHARLDHGLALAISQQARVVLVITGRPRPADAADRGSRRGAIRAKLLDWLAAGPHGARIAAVRGAHQKHGGAGALYLVLRRSR
jgi:DNA-nicking Smr family endonuclease